ncbi:type II toxin-antitoxin system RelE/ParE family toxin [Picosynechococcus sp. PCC 8807]|uniref:type II toxin-antitoxin system RelE/ParE family toxin n=1 Tax=Picosynechococcus sp. PCC 8807 TaxID=195248 RepID=UPI00081044A7|nr:type II toxin-antitoxin system RelE/ParE family toxin [Picosynechococcus sp. PCC 8807]ANV90154.1 hypothetical protein AWQ24_05675 [Picosynechococcus sp. PCC 8807]
MIIYQTRTFWRWAKKQNIADQNLCRAVQEILSGLHDGDLGSGLIKKRVARRGQGKRGGFRTLLAINQGDRCFFIYGFSKSERSNIDEREKEALKKLARFYLSLPKQDLKIAQDAGELVEVICNETI